MKLKQGTITLINKFGYEMETIPALRVGRLALHQHADEAGSGWRISHAPTGAFICLVGSGKDQALDVLEKIVAHKVDWNFRSTESPKFEAAKRTLLPSLREMYAAKLIQGNFKKPGAPIP